MQDAEERVRMAKERLEREARARAVHAAEVEHARQDAEARRQAEIIALELAHRERMTRVGGGRSRWAWIATGIIVVTRRGLFGQLVSSYRPARTPIYAFTNMSTSRRKLSLLRGVVPFRMRLSADPQKTIDMALARIREQVDVPPEAKFVVVSDVLTSSGELVTSIQVRDAG